MNKHTARKCCGWLIHTSAQFCVSGWNPAEHHREHLLDMSLMLIWNSFLADIFPV